MSTTPEYIEFVCEQIQNTGTVRCRKMFGEYMVYINDKPIFLVCDNTVYVKKLPDIKELMSGTSCGIPYEGAKEHYILDIENRSLAQDVIMTLEPIIPLPKKKRKN